MIPVGAARATTGVRSFAPLPPPAIATGCLRPALATAVPVTAVVVGEIVVEGARVGTSPFGEYVASVGEPLVAGATVGAPPFVGAVATVGALGVDAGAAGVVAAGVFAAGITGALAGVVTAGAGVVEATVGVEAVGWGVAGAEGAGAGSDGCIVTGAPDGVARATAVPVKRNPLGHDANSRDVTPLRWLPGKAV